MGRQALQRRKNKVKKVAALDAFSRPDAQVFFKMLIDAGCPEPPGRTYTLSMMGAICAGINKNQHGLDSLLEKIPDSTRHPESSRMARVEWCKKCIQIIG